MSGTPPDMEITAYGKTRNSGAKIGVGWTQEDGSISLVLNPGTALIYQPNMTYKVKKKISEAAPAVGAFKPTRFGYEPPKRPAAAKFDDFDDDIPF